MTRCLLDMRARTATSMSETLAAEELQSMRRVPIKGMRQCGLLLRHHGA